jgi:protein-disulfide isomerase-like protein with CxxC motif
VSQPPLDVLLYAASRPDPRERFVILTAVQMAYPVVRADPEWTAQLQGLRNEIGLKDAEHEAVVRRAGGIAQALRAAMGDAPGN